MSAYTGTSHRSYVVDTSVAVGDPLNFEKNTITQTYRVVRYSVTPPSPPAPPNGIDLPYGLDLALAETSPQRVLPVIGSPFPDTAPPSATWQVQALCRNHQAQKFDKYMDVRVVYDTYYHWLANARGIDSSGTVITPAAGNYLPARAIFSVKTRQTNLWRAVGTAPSATSDSVTTTSGAYVGQGATPIRADVSQVAIRLQLMIDADSQSNTVTATNIAAYIGKRNADTFMGYTAGQLVCVGGSLSHVEYEYSTVTMEYEYDEYFEHNQVCAVNNANQITLTAGNPTTVYWKRPTRTSVNFNDIWPAGDFGAVQRYMAERGKYWA